MRSKVEFAVDVSFIRPRTSTNDRTVHKRWFGPNRISFIEMDIEGAEYLALWGARKIIAKRKPIIVFENGRQAVANLYGFTPHDLFGFFDRLNYRGGGPRPPFAVVSID